LRRGNGGSEPEPRARQAERRGDLRRAEQRRSPPRWSRRGIGGSEPGPWAREAERRGTGLGLVEPRRRRRALAERSGDDRRHGGRGEGTGGPAGQRGWGSRRGPGGPAVTRAAGGTASTVRAAAAPRPRMVSRRSRTGAAVSRTRRAAATARALLRRRTPCFRAGRHDWSSAQGVPKAGAEAGVRAPAARRRELVQLKIWGREIAEAGRGAERMPVQGGATNNCPPGQAGNRRSWIAGAQRVESKICKSPSQKPITHSRRGRDRTLTTSDKFANHRARSRSPIHAEVGTEL
jgi:hypothetical protein